MTDTLGRAFGQRFVPGSRGGAGGMIVTEAAAKASPDGELIQAANIKLKLWPLPSPAPRAYPMG